MAWVVWPQAEDINAYGCNPELLAPLGEPIPPFSELEANAIDSYLHDNGRFVNYSDILLTAMTPRWLWAMLNLFFLTSLFLLVKATAATDEKNTITAPCIALMGIMMLVFIPWNDYLFLQRYMTPYLWGATMMSFVSFGLIRMATGRNLSLASTVLLCLVATVCGGWHEGLSLTLVCGIIPLWLMTPRETRKKFTTVSLFLLVGLLLNLTSPGQFNRADSVGVNLNIFNWFQPATITGGAWLWPHIVPMFIYIGILLAVATRNRKKIKLTMTAPRGWSNTLSSQSGFVKLQVFSFTVAAATLGMCLFFNAPRVATPGLLFSVIGLLSIVTHYYPDSKPVRKAIGIAATLCATLMTVNIGFNIAMQSRLSRDHQAIEKMLTNSDDGTVFYDPVEWPHKSHYPWQWNINHYYVDYVPLHFILTHPSNKRHLPLRLIPTALESIPESVTVDEITSLDGNFVSDREPEYTDPANAGTREEIYPEEYPYLKINAVVRTASGRQAIRFFEIIPFTTAKNTPAERDLYYFRPIWRSHSEVSDPAVELLTISPAKYW